MELKLRNGYQTWISNEYPTKNYKISAYETEENKFSLYKYMEGVYKYKTKSGFEKLPII